jgi:hypothetical protein
MAVHAGRHDECEHRRAYERALAYQLSQVTTQANAGQAVFTVSMGERVHDWSEDRAYFCPSRDCVCHNKSGC